MCLIMDITEAPPAASGRLAAYSPCSEGRAKPGRTPIISKSFAVLTPTRRGLAEVRPEQAAGDDDGGR